jgi:hypothetical protein
LNVILHFDLGYMDLSGLHASRDCLSQLRKYVFAMIQQLGPPIFFVHLLMLKALLQIVGAVH